MNAEDLAGNNGCNGKAIESVNEGLPDLDVTPPFALIIEAINAGHVRTFMISSKKKEVFGILEFVAQQQENRLQTLLSTVNIVAQEKIVGCRRKPAHLEQSDKIRVLAMYVADDLYRR
jgi:hypothetical protein